LNEICLKVYAALKHAHKQGWAHLDVRPANIITRAKLDGHPPGDRLEVMLIDWGCAYRNDKKVKGFIGCLPYAHDDLFRPSKVWQPRLDHDLASLAYSVVSLSLGSIPWAGFSNHLAVTNDVRIQRLGIARQKLFELFGPWESLSLDVKALFNAIDNPVKRKRWNGKWR
jgi:serine/threonine protein kinase